MPEPRLRPRRGPPLPPEGGEGAGVGVDPNVAEAMRIAAGICVYTNDQITIEEL